MEIHNINDFELILNCAVRYAIGRETYISLVVTDFIKPLIQDLSDRTLCVMKRDYEKQKEYGYGNPEIDKPVWDDFYKNVISEINSRKERRRIDK